jgi:hypothetical protein
MRIQPMRAWSPRVAKARVCPWHGERLRWHTAALSARLRQQTELDALTKSKFAVDSRVQAAVVAYRLGVVDEALPDS